MLTPDEFLVYCQRLELSTPARTLLAHLRAAPPARHVRGGQGNVTCRYPSRKMGCIIQAESHRNELPTIYTFEHDADVLEYYDQPPPLKLQYRTPQEKLIGVLHTPDFLVLRQARVGYEECKTEEALLDLAGRMPHRYVRDAQGVWQCPPGIQAAGAVGFYYQVRSSREINWTCQRNLLFLEGYLDQGCPAVPDAVVLAVQRLVLADPGLGLSVLRERAAPQATVDQINALIARAQVYVDLAADLLTDPAHVAVFPSQAVAQSLAAARPTTGLLLPPPVQVAPNAVLLWDGIPWTILQLGTDKLYLRNGQGDLQILIRQDFEALVQRGDIRSKADLTPAGVPPDAQARLGAASPAELAEANRRWVYVESLLRGQAPPDPAPPGTTVGGWLRAYRAAEQVYGWGYLGLLPRWSQRGNRQPKLPAATRQAQTEFIATQYEHLTQKSRRLVWGELVLACEQQGLVAPSYRTFCTAVAHRDPYEQTRRRQGSRAAYAQQEFYWELTPTAARHGERPWEVAHLDHTQLDIELRCSRTGQPLGRPWASFLVDAFSRRILALAVTYDPPSYRSCLLVLRDCVRRHQYLPQTLVVDGGPEFRSTYFETLLAFYRVTKKTRPWAAPHFGSVCERLFGTTNTQFVHNLTGNTQLTRQVRQVTAAVDPRQHAAWTLPALYTALETWATAIYDQAVHSTLGASPQATYQGAMQQHGERRHQVVPDDETFRLLTSPAPRGGTAQVQPGRGVKLHYIYYWATAMQDPAVEQTRVPVRYDPFDISHAYAYIGGRWVECIGEYHTLLHRHSERELLLASAELRQQHRVHQQHYQLTARALAEFLQSAEAAATLRDQRLRDAELRAVLAPAATDPSVPAALPPPAPASVPEPAAPAARPACPPFDELEDY